MNTQSKTRIVLLSLAAGLACSVAHAAEPATPASPAAPTREVLAAERTQAPNGQWFDIVKEIVDGGRVTTYTSGDLALSHDEFAAWCKKNPAPKVDDALAAALAKAQPADMVPVAIWMTDSPAGRIQDEVRALFQARIDALEARRDAFAQMDSASPIVDNLARANALADVRRGVAIDAESLGAEVRAAISAKLAPAVAPLHAALEAKVKQLGGSIRGFTDLVNGAEAMIPASAVPALAADADISRIVHSPAGQPELEGQAVSLGLTTGFWANGIDGGIWDGGQMDSGVDQNHPTFSGLTFLNGPGMGSEDSDGHGTAVASIIAGRNATNRGMAFGIDTHLNTTWNNVQTSVNWMFLTAADDPEVVNGSFGIPADAPSVADYTATEQYLDYMMRTQSFIYTKSAGNLGSGAQTLTQPAGIYNGLAVANVYDNDTVTRADDVITASSSRGPTISGRRKPDISAPGTNTTAANNNWDSPASTPDWINFGGTSSAAPHVGGGVLLLTDARSSDSPLPIKAILINSADTWTDGGTLASTADDGAANGSQWNATYGWGYLDLGAAYAQRNNVVSSTIAGSPAYKLYRVTLPANGKATLVWNRFVTAALVPQTLTDLDLYLYNAATGAQVSGSASTINNVEQVGTTAAGSFVIKVDAWSGIDPDIGATDAFALASTSAATEVALPTLGSVAVPGAVSPGEPFNLRVLVSNLSPDVAAHNVAINMNAAPAGWSISPTGVTNLGSLQASGQTVIAEYTVTPPCNLAGTTGNFTWSLTHNSYAQAYSVNDSQTLTVAPIAAIGTAATISASAPVTYSFAVANGDFHAVGAFSSSAAANINVRGDNDACITSPWHQSDFSDRTDFVIVNGNATGSTTQYAHIYDGNGTNAAVNIRHDNGFDFAVSTSFNLAATDPLYVVERSMTVGKTYRILADITSGAGDLAILGYRPDSTYSERSTAGYNRDAAGPGGDERFNLTAPISGVYGFVLANDNRQAAQGVFTARCIADYNSTNVTEIDDIFLFLNLWFSNNIEADIDLNNSIEINDIFQFLNFWFAGC